VIKNLKYYVEKNAWLDMILRPLYQNTLGKYAKKKRNEVFLKYGKEALFAMQDAFLEMDKTMWLEFGTLLGAIREKDFISHDFDIDIACFHSEYSKNDEYILKKYGFKKVREILVDEGVYGREETYQYKGVDIDIFYFYKRKNEIYCHEFAFENDKGWNSSMKNMIVKQL
jgi:hypothetical protein